MKIAPSNTAINSATTTEIQIPSIPQINGSSIMDALWKSIVRRNEISAEVRPSLNAVKKPEANIPKPIKPKDSAKIRKPDTVRSNNSASYPTNIFESGWVSASAAMTIPAPNMPMIARLFRISPFNSAWFRAP